MRTKGKYKINSWISKCTQWMLGECGSAVVKEIGDLGLSG